MHSSSANPASARSRRADTIYVLLCAAVAIACYLNTLANDFAYDDIPIIVENPLVTGGEPWNAIWTTDYWAIASHRDAQRDLLYRPVAIATYRLNYLLTALQPAAYHLTNLLIHAVVTWLLFTVIRRQTASPRFALACAVLFAALPIHTEAVANVVGRAELLAALFTLLAIIWLALPGADDTPRRRVLRLVGGGVAAFAAIGAKESGAAVFLLVPLFYAWSILQRRSAIDRADDAAPTTAPRCHAFGWSGVALAIAFALYVVLRFNALGGQFHQPVTLTRTVNALVDTVPGERVLGAFQLWGMYWAKTFWPETLSSDYSINAVTLAGSIGHAHVLLGMAMLVLLVVVAAAAAASARTSARAGRLLPACWLAALLICYLPASNTLVLIKVFFGERLWYVPSLWAAPLVCWPLWRVSRRFYVDTLRSPQTRRWIGWSAVSLLVMAGMVRCWIRNAEWRNNGTVFAAGYRDYPDAVANLCHYANWLVDHGRTDEAIPLFEKALLIDLGFTHAHRGLGYALLQAGRPEEALHHLAIADAQIPNHPRTEALLAQARAAVDALRADDLANAEQRVRDNPDDVDAVVALADLLAELGRFDEAADRLAEAEPRFGERSDTFLHRLAVAEVMAGRTDAAIRHYRALIARSAAAGPYRIELAMVLLDRRGPGELDEALDLARRAYESDAQNVQVRMGYAEALAITGHRGDAAALYRVLAGELPAGTELQKLCRSRAEALGE